MVKMEFDLFAIMLFSFFNINKIMRLMHTWNTVQHNIYRKKVDHLYNVLYFSYRLCICLLFFILCLFLLQALYLDAVCLFSGDKVEEIVDLMTEKEIRLQIPLEEVDILMEEIQDKKNEEEPT